ncbi:hypothetical protein JHK82_018723 [Glycine max]|nr:hypothetical protein JHK85_019165 [Glycine max]KAG5143028.1 hypothetical protein JHK82_018723 [Glycine max]
MEHMLSESTTDADLPPVALAFVTDGEVFMAQEALLKVFDRILDVVVETTGTAPFDEIIEVSSDGGDERGEQVRTSSGTFLARGHDKIVRDIEKRIADFTFIPVEHGEGIQVLHYEVGQKYEPHYDYYLNDFNTKNRGQRIATMLMLKKGVRQCSQMPKGI